MGIGRSFVFVICVVLLSCNKDSVSEYLYNYLKEPVDAPASYYIIDMHGCDNCIENNLQFLGQNRVRVTLIFVGKINSKKWHSIIKKLGENYIILYDEERMAGRMELALSSPLLVVTSKGKVIMKRNIKDSQLDILLEL